MADWIVPLLLLVISVHAVGHRLDLYSLLQEGAKDGLATLLRIFPALLILLSAVGMLRVSGAMDVLTKLLTPCFSLLGIPPETAPLVLIRPFSGSAALAIGADLMQTYGADSTIGRTAAVMLGSTETTFYTVSVYFGAAGIRDTRHTIPAALIADLTGFAMAALTVRLLF